MYSAYDAALLIKIQGVCSYFGYLTIAASVIALGLSLWKRKNRRLVTFSSVAIVVTTVAFFQTQAMGVQHIYTIAVEFCILQFVMIELIAACISKRMVRAGWVAGCLGVCICGSLNCFFPATRGTFANVSSLFSTEYDPMQREDVDALCQMVDYVNSLTEGTDTKVYITASGSVLNSAVITMLYAPDNLNPMHNLCDTADVDLRDGFNSEFLEAGVVITTSPIQLHLAEGSQEVVRYLSEQVTDTESPIGRHFEKDEMEFLLDDGVVASIYVKTSDYEQSDLEALAAYFAEYYPGQETLFADRILGE